MLPVQFIHPPAAGGGTPEIIAFLNGIIVHGSLSLKNLVVKFTANVFAVSSGLPAAIQAPIITYGSVTVDRQPPITQPTHTQSLKLRQASSVYFCWLAQIVFYV